MKGIKVWKLDNEIKTRADLVGFLIAATEDVDVDKLTRKDMAWLAIACNDFNRIAKQKGWID